LRLRLGYVIPEFPNQTHIFLWREVEALRRLGVEVLLASTRKPFPIVCRHDFATTAVEETHYLFPPSIRYQLSWVTGGSRGLRPLFRYIRSLEASGLKNRIRQLALLASAIDLLEWSGREKIDHIHGHSCADLAHVLAMSRWAGGPPYSLTLHGDLDIYGGDYRAKMEKAAFITAVGNHLRSQVVNKANVPADRVLVSFMGVKASELASLGRHRSRISGSLHIVTVARLHRAKAHLNALTAVDGALRQGIDIRYTIAGEGPHRDAIVSRIAELGLRSRVILTGTLSEAEVFQLLSDADAFVLPSAGLIGEAWPVSVMEAMGAGLPVIATVIGATPEMITSGVDGFLIAQGDNDALREVIVALANDVELRFRIGDAARQTARRRFDVSATAGVLRDAIISSLSENDQLRQSHLPAAAGT
jgi:glycosyltransferase involved in cell wall biosynthesis